MKSAPSGSNPTTSAAAGSSAEVPVSLVLVVKGAGNQKPDDSLDLFTGAFAAAVRREEPRSTIRERNDIFDDRYRMSPHDKGEHDHLFEINTPDRRIWIREVNWEVGLRPAQPLTALGGEWRMASFVYLLEVHRWIGGALATALGSYPAPTGWLSKWILYVALLLTHVGVFGLTAFVVGADLSRGIAGFGASWPVKNAELIGTGAILLFAAVASVPIAVRLWRWHAQGFAADGSLGPSGVRQPAQPPALSNALLVLLVLALLYSPINYLAMLFILLLSHLGLLFFRSRLWPARAFEASDIETHWRGSPYRPGTWPTRRDRPGIRLALFLYRGIVALALPLFFVLLAIAKLLRWSRVLERFGQALEQLLGAWLGGIMGDVVTYAMDPAQAARIRSCVATDIEYFGRNVDDIHVFAHSQGTPITFELLYRHLAREQLAKVRTYMTIGSVLSYYHSADPVLDAYGEDQRFPVAEYPGEFPAGYRWYNIWNFSDPITEFYGLDEYIVPRDERNRSEPFLFEEPPPRMPGVHRAGPRSIRSPASRRNHSDYWTNQPWVIGPLARRVLGRPEEFPAEPWLGDTGRLSHATKVFAGHALATTLALALGAWLLPYVNDAWLDGAAWLRSLDDVQDGTRGPIQGLIGDVAEVLAWLAESQWKAIRTALIAVAAVVAVQAPWAAWFGRRLGGSGKN